MTPEPMTFAAVGAVAAAVHFGVVSALVPFGVLPTVANVFGFLAAFGVSFVGHSRWSFPSANRQRARALARFFAVASTAFVLNETLYWTLLQRTALSYRQALIVVLAVVAVLTFVSSKYWAFAGGAREPLDSA